MSTDVGPGWRRLEVGEVRQEGDEFSVAPGHWHSIGWVKVGWELSVADYPHRRRVPDAAKAEAEAPQPVPVASATQDGKAMSDIDVGEGWRRLEVGEVIDANDEYHGEIGWKRVPRFAVGRELGQGMNPHPHRRRVTDAAKAEAPEPVAWGVMFCENGLSLGHYAERYEAEAVCRATNNGESDCPYGPVTVVPLYATPPAPHPWCSDVARDEAVRRAEDAAPREELPEWSELPGVVSYLDGRVSEHADLIDGLEARVAALEADAAPGLRSLANNLRDKLRCCEEALNHSEARVAELEAAKAASESGTVRVRFAYGINRRGQVVVEGSQEPFERLWYVSLDLTPAQVAEIERQARGEGGR